jgi:hypothetical protein
VTWSCTFAQTFAERKTAAYPLTMLQLRFDADRIRYLGERTIVDGELFEDAVAELVEGGADESEARRRLLDEAEWVDVEAAALPLCLHCREPLPPELQFCDVVCEAAFIAEVHG